MMSDDMMIMMSDQLSILQNTKIKLFSPGLLLHSAEDGREEQEEVGDLVMGRIAMKRGVYPLL